MRLTRDNIVAALLIEARYGSTERAAEMAEAIFLDLQLLDTSPNIDALNR